MNITYLHPVHSDREKTYLANFGEPKGIDLIENNVNLK